MPDQVPPPPGCDPAIAANALVGQDVGHALQSCTLDAVQTTMAAFADSAVRESIRRAVIGLPAVDALDTDVRLPPSTVPASTATWSFHAGGATLDPKWLAFVMDEEPDPADGLTLAQSNVFRAVIAGLNNWYRYRASGGNGERPPQLLLHITGGPGCGTLLCNDIRA